MFGKRSAYFSESPMVSCPVVLRSIYGREETITLQLPRSVDRFVPLQVLLTPY